MKSPLFATTAILGVLALTPSSQAASPWSASFVGTGDGELGQPTLSLAPAPIGGFPSVAFQVPAIVDDSVEHRAVWTTEFGSPTQALYTLLTKNPGAGAVVATDSYGEAFVAWREADGLHVRGQDGGGAPIPEEVVIPTTGGARIGSFRLSAVSGRTAAVVAVRIEASGRRTLVGALLGEVGWQDPTVLGGAEAIPSFALTGAGRGEFHVVWATVTSGVHRMRHTRGAGTGWSAAATVPNVAARWVGVAMGDNHRGSIAWISATPDRSLRTRSFKAMAVSPVTRTHSTGVVRASIASDATGRSLLAWPYRTDSRAGVWLRSGVKGAWSTPLTRWVPLREGRVMGLDVAANPRGDAIAVWSAISTDVDRAVHGAAFRLAGAPFGAAEIRAAKQDTRNPDPMTEAVISPDGRAFASHGLSSGNCCFDIAVGERPGVAIPTPADLSVTTQPSIGRVGVTFTLDRPGRVLVAAQATGFGRPSVIRLVNGRAGGNMVTLPLAALTPGTTWRVVVGPSTGVDDPGTKWSAVP